MIDKKKHEFKKKIISKRTKIAAPRACMHRLCNGAFNAWRVLVISSGHYLSCLVAVLPFVCVDSFGSKN